MDSKNEQDENLKEILGFDPKNPQRNEGNKDITPLRKASIATGIPEDQIRLKLEEEAKVFDWDYCDSDNLFSIRGYWKYHMRYATAREYYRLQQGENYNHFSRFTTTYVFIRPHQKYADFEVGTSYDGEHNDSESMFFSNKGIKLSKFINRKRLLIIKYNKGCTLKNVEFVGEFSWRKIEASFAKAGERKIVITKPENGNDNDFAEGAKINHTIKNGNIQFTFTKDEKVTDQISIPINLGKSTDDVKHEMYPDELLHNPSSHDPRLDDPAKAILPFERLGISWEIF